jgi:hypothetical protein
MNRNRRQKKNSAKKKKQYNTNLHDNQNFKQQQPNTTKICMTSKILNYSLKNYWQKMTQHQQQQKIAKRMANWKKLLEQKNIATQHEIKYKLKKITGD